MFQNAVYLKWQLRHVLNLFGHYFHVLTDMTYLNKRFITIIDKFGNKKKIRTEAEKARRRAEEQAQKVYKEKKLQIQTKNISVTLKTFNLWSKHLRTSNQTE